MQKTKVLCMILAMVLATAGTAGVVVGLGGNSDVPPIVPDNVVNTVLDRPVDGTPTDRSAIDNLYIAQGELQRKGGFVGTTRGSTTSAGIKQEVINNRVVSNGNVFKEMITVGIVKNAYQLFMYEGNYLYRKFDSIKSASSIKWADTASKYSEADFLLKFGHRSNALTGYILNDDTIVSGTLEKEENGLFQYRYVLDVNTAPAYMLREMKTNSNMSGYSTFTKAEIVVVMDAEWQVKTVTTDCKYKVPMFGGVDCVEDITETFSELDGQELPEKAFFEQFFDADVVDPVDKDPDALSILMDIFSPYIGNGNSLNASVVATDNGQPLLNALISAKIDIENLQNIEVSAKLGNGLYVEYEQGKIYVAYQDFKASTTVEGITGLISALVPNVGIADEDVDDADNDILSKFTYKIVDGVCVVSLPLELGENKIELNIYANVTENGYEFVNAEVIFGTLEVKVEITEAFDMPERNGDYPEILGLLDLAQNGVIYGNVSAFGFGLDVMFDLNSMSLYAKGDDLSVIYKDNSVYAEYGAIKAKLAISDVERIVAMLRLAGVIDGDASVTLPEISLDKILSLLGDVKAVSTDDGVKFALSLDDLSVAIYLVTAENGWNVDKIAVEFDGNVITVSASARDVIEMPEIDENSYADVMELLDTFVNPVASLISAKSYGAEFNFGVSVNGKTYDVDGAFTYDANKNIKASAVVANGSVKLVNANVVVFDNVVYLDVNGIKTAFNAGATPSDVDLTELINNIYGLNDNVDGVIEAIYGIIDVVAHFDLSKLDVANLVSDFRFENGELSLTINASLLGLDEINLTLSADKFNGLTVGLDGLKIANVELTNVRATLTPNVAKVKSPNASDYILNLKGNVEGAEFNVSADLLNMDIYASVNALGNTALVRFVGGKVYATVGEVAITANPEQLGALVKEIMSAIGAEQTALPELPDIDLSLKTLVDAIALSASDGSLSVLINLDGLASVSVDFDEQAEFVGISATVFGVDVNVVKSDEQAPCLELDKTFIPVEPLAGQITAIYNKYKDVLTSGIAVELNSDVELNGVAYALTAVVNYNNGLYLNAKIRDNTNVLADLDLYYVDNAIYLDINGVRVASELPEISTEGNLNIATVVGLLSKAKGYNEVLDSVIEVIEQLPEKFNSINYVDLIGSLSYANDTLSAEINGELLGLSNFKLTLSGTSNVQLTITDLAIGNVKVNSLTVDANPACGKVTAPTSEYVTELQLNVMGFTVTAKLDLLNKTAVAKTTLFGHELGIYYANDTVYVSYGAVKAKAQINDIAEIVAIVTNLLNVELPDIQMPELNVNDILNGISKETTTNGFNLKASVAGVNLTLSFDQNAKLANVLVNVKETEITATLVSDATYPAFDLTADYVDLLSLVNAFSADVSALINAQGYDVTVEGSFAFDKNVYTAQANVIYNGGLYVNANVSYNTANMLNVELWLVDNVLYASVGDLKLAISVSQSKSDAQGGSNKIDLTSYKGYNPYVDGILDAVQGVIDRFTAGNVDYVALIGGLSFNNGELALSVNGTQLGIAPFNAVLSSVNGLNAQVSNLAIAKLTASFNATVKASDTAVQAPKGDFTTNLSIKVDDKNTIYANLDLINKVFNFRLDDMYAMYADNVVKINKGDLYVSGNVNQIVDYVKQIDDLVNKFSGAQQSTAKINLDMFKNIDVKAIVNSLKLTASGEQAVLSLKALGFDVTATFADGKLVCASVPVNIISDKTLEIEPRKAQTYNKFDGEHDYIQIEQVFNDYFPAFERLVNTNSWAFYFDGDAELYIGKQAYKVSAGSYLEFYYKNTEGMDTFKLRAKLDVHKQKADNSWQPFMNIDVMYKDGNIYVTDRGRLIDGKEDADRSVLKLTVSVDTLVKCYGLYDQIVAVVPQIGELVNSMLDAMKEAENNAQNISYSTVLNDVSYVGGVFGLDLNAKALLSKLGEVSLSAQTYGEGLSLNELMLTYDTISLHLTNMRVYASEVDASYEQSKLDPKWNGGMQYDAVKDICSYDTSAYHIDFNSLYELLSSFVITATPAEGSNGVRSFYIEGTVFVKLSVIAQLKIGLAVKVDITANNDVFISAKVHRDQPTGLSALAYEDKGGDSYLNYDSTGNYGAGSFTVMRDSMKTVSGTHKADVEEMYYYCDLCNKDAEKKLLGGYQCPTKKGWFDRLHDDSHIQVGWRVVKNQDVPNTALDSADKCFYEYNISTEKFTANIVDYIMKMFNFSSMISNPINDAIKKENTNDFGIEDIFKDYYYSEQERKYSLNLDLTAIDSNLGAVQLNILHNADDFSLTALNGNVKLLGTFCDANFNMSLKPSVYGETEEIVSNNSRW